MAMTTPQREETLTWVCRNITLFADQGAVGVTKPQIMAAIIGIDEWIDAAGGTPAPPTGLMPAIPLPVRNGTAAQITLLFCAVALRRAGLLGLVGG